MVCSLTSARGEHLNLPYEQNSFSDTANNKLATVPVAHCELAAYPKPAAADVKDDCAGTGLGYLGGTALLTRTRPVRRMPVRRHTNGGRVRAQGGQERPAQSKLPVLADGRNLERNGLRCSAYNAGVACGNVSGGVGLLRRRDHYELFPRRPKTPPPAPVEGPKNPVI